jgi:hypothetical protein
MTNSEKFDPVPAVQISWVEGKTFINVSVERTGKSVH